MTKEERRQLRRSLSALGFRRTASGDDVDNNGAYWEIFMIPGTNNRVTIDWAPRAV